MPACIKGGEFTEEYIVAVCDISEKYALRMADELGKRLSDSYQIYAYTSMEELNSSIGQKDIFLLLISESSFKDVENQINPERIVILSEEGIFADKYHTIDRYQSCEEIMREVLCFLSDQRDFLPVTRRAKRWKVIGLYSPIKRCLQTSFALLLGQKLAEKKKVLYISFENFPVLSGMQSQNLQNDITDILYLFECDPEKLRLKLPVLVRKLEGLDYLPPATAFFDTYDRTGEKWMELLTFLEQNTDYEYLIMDLSESVQGLLFMLQYCDRIYSLERGDSMARCKLLQYEQWMKQNAYADIIDKTLHFNLPQFQDIPEEIELLTHSELATYVNAVIKEDLDG